MITPSSEILPSDFTSPIDNVVDFFAKKLRTYLELQGVSQARIDKVISKKSTDYREKLVTLTLTKSKIFSHFVEQQLKERSFSPTKFHQCAEAAVEALSILSEDEFNGDITDIIRPNGLQVPIEQSNIPLLHSSAKARISGLDSDCQFQTTVSTLVPLPEYLATKHKRKGVKQGRGYRFSDEERSIIQALNQIGYSITLLRSNESEFNYLRGEKLVSLDDLPNEIQTLRNSESL